MQKLLQRKKRKYNVTNLIQNEFTALHQQQRTNYNNNRTLTIGFSKSGKTYLMKYYLLQKQEPNIIIKKSLNQSPNIKAQMYDEVHQHKIMKTALLFLMIWYYPNKQAILICFLQENVSKILLYTLYLEAIIISQIKLLVRILMKFF